MYLKLPSLQLHRPHAKFPSPERAKGSDKGAGFPLRIHVGSSGAGSKPSLSASPICITVTGRDVLAVAGARWLCVEVVGQTVGDVIAVKLGEGFESFVPGRAPQAPQPEI